MAAQREAMTHNSPSALLDIRVRPCSQQRSIWAVQAWALKILTLFYSVTLEFSFFIVPLPTFQMPVVHNMMFDLAVLRMRGWIDSCTKFAQTMSWPTPSKSMKQDIGVYDVTAFCHSFIFGLETGRVQDCRCGWLSRICWAKKECRKRAVWVCGWVCVRCGLLYLDENQMYALFIV